MAKDKPQVIDAEKLPKPDGRPICFVAMPYGRTEEEVVWFCGWYQEVIMPAVEIAGYRAILAANILEPTAINDEIRRHLIHDPMTVVDLGGFTPQDAPNPNVMYELGIRHAAALPHVLMAWEGQRLPFDVSNQRAIVKKRGLLDFADNRRELTAFITAAREGKFYRPMDALHNVAALEAAAKVPEGDKLIQALTIGVLGMHRRIDDLLERLSQADIAAGQKQRETILDKFIMRPLALAEILSQADPINASSAMKLLSQPVTTETALMVRRGTMESIKQWLADRGVHFFK